MIVPFLLISLLVFFILFNFFHSSLCNSLHLQLIIKFNYNLHKTKATGEQFGKERQKSSASSRGFKPNVEEMKFVFDKFDTNKNGRIRKEEYVAAVRILGKGTVDAEMIQAFKAIDADGDGFIDFQEFTEMMQKMGDGVNASDIQNVFRKYDLDGNGKISAEELMEVMKKMGERYTLEAGCQMIRAVDANGDGLIDNDEFVTMITRTMKLA